MEKNAAQCLGVGRMGPDFQILSITRYLSIATVCCDRRDGSSQCGQSNVRLSTAKIFFS
jgi:hypothetical protein